MKKNYLLMGALVAVVCTVVLLLRQNERQSERSINIGALMFLTGTFADTAQSMVRGMQMAVEENNIRYDGGRVVQLNVEDGKTEAKASVAAVQKLLQDKIDLLILSGDNQVPAVANMTNRAKIPAIVPVTANSSWLSKDGEVSWMFRYFTSSYGVAHLMAEFGAKELKAKTGSVLYLNSEYGLDGVCGFRDAFVQCGGEIVAEELFAESMVNIRAQIEKILTKNPDVVYVVGYGVGYYSSINQLRERGFSGQILTCEHITSPESRANVKDLEGIYFVTQTTPSSARYQKFSEKFRVQFGRDPDIYAAYGYDSINILLSAYDSAGGANEGIRRRLSQVKSYPAVLGDVSFCENGECIIQLTCARMNSDGSYKILR